METDNENSNDRIGLRVTAYSAMGSRKYMEDTFSVAYQKSDNGKDLDYAFFGIFDGHGGDTASIFAKNHLMNYIVDQPGFWSNNDTEMRMAIKQGFLDCHHAMWKDLDKWPPTASGLPSTAGTTASVAFLRKGKLYIGQCGDSGIALGHINPKGGKWLSKQLTVEHKPESPEELERIESHGGKVQQKQGIHRVVWYRPKNPHQGPIRRNTRIEEVPFLAVARSLGDLWSYNYKTEKFVVSPEPDVEIIEVDVNTFKCLIFASDGLWNVFDPDYAVECVYETERRNDHNAKLGINTWRNPSRILVESALEKWRSNGMRADNTSVVCVMLDPPNKRNLFKFCRPPTTEATSEPQDGPRTIFDYSTNQAYNLDYGEGFTVDSLTRQNASYDLLGNNQYAYFQPPLATHNETRSFHYLGSQNQQTHSSGYSTYDAYSGYQTATSSHHHQPETLTYQTTSNESAFVKACCRNNYLLANANEDIPYHSSYEQHRQMYQNMALRPYPPLHYAYRPVPTIQQPLPSLHTNLYDHHGYLPNYKPMERYNYLRPTPEEVAALHNEDEDSSDSEMMDFSDEDSDEAENQSKVEPTSENEQQSADNSVQIFEISSTNFNEKASEGGESQNDEFKKQSNNKENSDRAMRRKKTAVGVGRFYATRQTDRKMRSGNVGSQSGVQRTIGKEKHQRRVTRNIRKVVKTFSDPKAKKFELLAGASKKVVKGNENKPTEAQKSMKTTRPKKPSNDRCTVIIRSLRSNSNNVMKFERPATRKRTNLFDNLERPSRERRLK